MIKKKYLVILFSLLLVALLGMFSNCYAVEKGQVQNIAYNWYTNYMNWSDETTRQFITSKDSGFDNVLDFFNENYGIIALKNNSTEFYVYIVPNNYSTNNQQYISRNNYGWYIYEIGWIRFTSNSISSLKRTSVYGGRCGINTDVVYTDFPIYNGNNSSSTIVYSAGYHTPTWFNLEGDYYSSYVWQFIQNGSNISINNDRWPYKLIDSGYNINLGVLTDSVWTQSIEYKIDYYNTNTQKFDNTTGWRTMFNKDRDDTILVKYSNVTSQSNGLYSTSILFDTYKYKDCILSLKIDPWAEDDNTFVNLYAFYYIRGSNTYIEGGVTYPTITFSGDYIGDYNQQKQDNMDEQVPTDIADIRNALTDSSFSGDVSLPTIEIEDPTGDFFTWFYTQFVAVLNNNNNTYITIPIWRTDYRIYSNVFVFPNGVLRNFIQARLVVYRWFTVFKIY